LGCPGFGPGIFCLRTADVGCFVIAAVNNSTGNYKPPRGFEQFELAAAEAFVCDESVFLLLRCKKEQKT
jgi:hypothetical protein